MIGKTMRFTRLSLEAAGFTIVESLIVLAVTTFLFGSVVLLISGRQHKTEFQTAINSARQQVEQIINQTASGYFPSNNTYNCSANSGVPTITTVTDGGAAQGTNTGCVFLGKVVFFGSSDSDGDQQFITWPIVGNQNIASLGASGTTADQTISKAIPNPVDPARETTLLGSGLHVTAMYYNSSVSLKTAGVGFLAGDSTGLYAGGGANGLNSGSLQLSLYSINNTQAIATNQSQILTQLASSTTSNNYRSVSSVEICLASGTTDQSGLLTIGNTSASAVRQLSVTLKIANGQDCNFS